MNSIVRDDIANIVSLSLPWNRFSNSTVVVSGASGFIASYIVKTLMNRGAHVVAIVKNKEKARGKFSQFLKNKHLHVKVQDINDPMAIRGKIDYVIHAASYASPKHYSVDPIGTLQANTIGTMNLLKLARAKRVKGFLFLSSAEIYGTFLNSSQKISENSYGFVNPVTVRACYAESKRMGEAMCIAWHHQFGVPVKIVRLFHTYGPGMSLDDGRVHADFVANVVRGENIVMKSEGTVKRTFCYIADTVAGLFTVLLKGGDGEVYNIGNPKAEITVLELARLVAHLSPDKKTRVIKRSRSYGEKYIESPIDRCIPDISKIFQLDWKPKYSLKEGFERTIQSYLL